MDLDFLSGLLLALVAFAILGYLIVALMDTGDRDLNKRRHDLWGALTKMVASDAKPINDHLIGATGKVIAHSDDTARPMRVRINAELWPARSSSAHSNPPAVGVSIKVAAVDGPVLVVEASTDAR